ncbi:helix-turn-helix domain-containing protein [Aliisedimentitalea scapharcae]|uniref:Helix-turn-helix domain-containing protein n=1 Tax=Aliisedimentitalea scapharcae TaxID=1524259 RepID=A0ABZ2XP42_9RHOB
MKNRAISTRWFPAYGFCEGQSGLFDNVFTDFDQQAEQLAGHDQSYLQLTPGAFHGRFLSAFFGPDVSIHLEYCNQALEQEVIGSPDHFTFGVTLDAATGFTSKGRPLSEDHFFLLPPSGNLHVISPNHGVVMAIAIRSDAFLKHPVLSPEIMEWVMALEDDIGILRAPRFAYRMREDAISAVEGLAQDNGSASSALIGQALIAGIMSKLALEWSTTAGRRADGATPVFNRFDHCRFWLRSRDATRITTDDIAQFAKSSRRSVEQSFSDNVSMGPLTYMRVVRLHDVRRTMLDPSFRDHSIGDIAARHGFWDWSRFSNQYRRHFGELPSATRKSRANRC